MLYINFTTEREITKSIEISEKDYQILKPYGIECLVGDAVGEDYTDYFDKVSITPKGEVIKHNWQQLKNDVRRENYNLKTANTLPRQGRVVLSVLDNAAARKRTQPVEEKHWATIL